MSTRPATVDDVHRVAAAMPHVTLEREGPKAVYQVGRKSFVFFRTPRPDAVDPDTGERYDDVIVIWVPEDEKQPLVDDPTTPWFTTAHFDGHPSVLVRGCRIGELSVDEVTGAVEDAWLTQASPTRALAWLAENRPNAEP
jgi:hypothetical protein